MKYRDIEYAVSREADGDSWRWTVDLDSATSESGQRKTRESALSAVVLTVDRFLTRKRAIAAQSQGDAEHGDAEHGAAG